MALGNIRVVLMRPRGAANVGATARAMKNMGLHELVLVRPAAAVRAAVNAPATSPAAYRAACAEEAPDDASPATAAFWSKALAVHAEDVLSHARCCETLAEAVVGCSVVAGTTCRDGLYRAAAESPRVAAPRLVAAAENNRVALVFGPEDHGLSNEDLKACHQLICIPSDPGYASLNLAQAVMVCCYELFLAANGNPENIPVLAPAERVALLFDRLQSALLSIGFLHADNPDHIMFALRRLLGRAQMEDRDVRILLGLARQIEWYGRDGWKLAAPRPGAEDELDVSN